jgi:hypothetical protein
MAAIDDELARKPPLSSVRSLVARLSRLRWYDVRETSQPATALDASPTNKDGAIITHVPALQNTAAIEPDAMQVAYVLVIFNTNHDISTMWTGTELPLARLPALRSGSLSRGGLIICTRVAGKTAENRDEL